MKFKNLLFFFFISLSLSLAARFIQILFVEDAQTGFFLAGAEVIGGFLSALIAVCALCPAVLSLALSKSPKNPPQMNLFLAISSFLLCFAIIFEILTEQFTANIRVWQIVSLELLGLLSAVFFLLYGFKTLLGVSVPKFFAVVPVLYWIMRLICIFTSISAISLIVDNVITLASHCALLIFVSGFGKLLNDVGEGALFRKVSASGLCAATLCAVDSVPRIFFKYFGNTEYIHSGVSSEITVFASGLFIVAFLCAYFAKRKFKH